MTQIESSPENDPPEDPENPAKEGKVAPGRATMAWAQVMIKKRKQEKEQRRRGVVPAGNALTQGGDAITRKLAIVAVALLAVGLLAAGVMYLTGADNKSGKPAPAVPSPRPAASAEPSRPAPARADVPKAPPPAAAAATAAKDDPGASDAPARTERPEKKRRHHRSGAR